MPASSKVPYIHRQPTADPAITPPGTRLWHCIFGFCRVLAYLPDGQVSIGFDSNGSSQPFESLSNMRYADDVNLYKSWDEIQEGDLVQFAFCPLSRIRETTADGYITLSAYNDRTPRVDKIHRSGDVLDGIRKISLPEKSYILNQWRKFRTRSRTEAWEGKIAQIAYMTELCHIKSTPHHEQILRYTYEGSRRAFYLPSWKEGFILSLTPTERQAQVGLNLYGRIDPQSYAWTSEVKKELSRVAVCPTWHKPAGYQTTLRHIREGRSTVTALLELDIHQGIATLPLLAFDERYLHHRDRYFPGCRSIMGLTGFSHGQWKPHGLPHAVHADVEVLEVLPPQTNLGVHYACTRCRIHLPNWDKDQWLKIPILMPFDSETGKAPDEAELGYRGNLCVILSARVTV